MIVKVLVIMYSMEDHVTDAIKIEYQLCPNENKELAGNISPGMKRLGHFYISYGQFWVKKLINIFIYYSNDD